MALEMFSVIYVVKQIFIKCVWKTKLLVLLTNFYCNINEYQFLSRLEEKSRIW